MINRISVSNVSSVNSSDKSKIDKSSPNFKGGPLDLAVAGLAICEANPMWNVAVADLATAIIPRTVIESQTNPYAGLEAFRRESSGLIINCMIPGVIVAGIAKMAGSGIMGGKTKMADCWANEDTIETVKQYWNKAEGNTQREKIEDTIKKILENIEGPEGSLEGNKVNTVEFNKFKNKFDASVKIIADEVEKQANEPPKGLSERWKYNKTSKNNIKSAFEGIVEQTHVSENIKIKKLVDGKEKIVGLDQSLKDIVNSLPRLLHEFSHSGNVEDLAKRAKKLVTAKSALGLGVIIPLALSAQPINRWITEKTSGKKGAPIYKDFTQSKDKNLNGKEKEGLATQKLISVSSMVGVALLSICAAGKKINMDLVKSVFQFKGIFPSMDQARIISTATFASRMAASQDKNDLREATVRDIATFSAFYFLGDYVAKGVATLIENTSKTCKKAGIKLVNNLQPLEKNANVLDKIKHWTSGTALKKTEELWNADSKLLDYAKKMHGICQLSGLGFSLIALGLLIPKLNRKKTDKERQKELEQMGVDKNTINKYYPPFEMNTVTKTEPDTFSDFFTSKN